MSLFERGFIFFLLLEFFIFNSISSSAFSSGICFSNSIIFSPMQKILVTGFGGFIGYTLVQQLKDKFQITAFDNFSDFSNYEIKRQRAAQLGITDFEAFKKQTSFQSTTGSFYYADLCNVEQLDKFFASQQFDCIIHSTKVLNYIQAMTYQSHNEHR